MWGEVGVTQPLSSSPLLGNQRLTKASESCDSYVYVDALLLLSIDDVVHVSDASPLYIFIFNISCSTPLTILPIESCTHTALGSNSTLSTTDRHMVDYITWWQRFLYESASSGEVGELIWRRGSRSFTGSVFPPGSRGLFLV